MFRVRSFSRRIELRGMATKIEPFVNKSILHTPKKVREPQQVFDETIDKAFKMIKTNLARNTKIRVSGNGSRLTKDKQGDENDIVSEMDVDVLYDILNHKNKHESDLDKKVPIELKLSTDYVKSIHARLTMAMDPTLPTPLVPYDMNANTTLAILNAAHKKDIVTCKTLFDNNPRPSLQCVNALLFGYQQMNDISNVISLFSQIHTLYHRTPNTLSYEITMLALSNANLYIHANTLLYF